MPKQVFNKISKERQNKLLKSSLSEFVSKPYEKITVQSLTDTMKILRTDFYYYFSDKEDIYSLILSRFHDQVVKNNPEAKFHDAVVALFDRVVTFTKSSRNRQWLKDLTESYDPQFAKELGKRCRCLFNCKCEGDKPQVKVMMKIYKFMTITNLYCKNELSLESAKEMIAD